MPKSNIVIIEGLDRLGKSSLIENIIRQRGFHNYLHYEKPKAVEYYGASLEAYQRDSFRYGFNLISNAQLWSSNIVFDRFHLGEYVYSPMYRGYDGDYVFDLESECIENLVLKKAEDTIKLILLTSSDFSFISDDGLSFNPENKEKEQIKFIEAFNKSAIVNKVIIDVHNGNGGFKTPQEIYLEAFE